MAKNRAPARLMIVRRLLKETDVASQEQLVELLAAEGHSVTQATVSRDLSALGAEKRLGKDGERYALPDEKTPQKLAELARRMREFVVDMGFSANNVVLKTPPGAGGTVAAALDGAGLDEVLGSVTGDDTVLIVTRDPNGGEAMVQRLKEILETSS